MRIAGLVLALLTLIGAGCTPQLPNIAGAGVVEGGVPLTAPHTLSPGDTFDVRFVFDPTLNDSAVVGADGSSALTLCSDHTRSPNHIKMRLSKPPARSGVDRRTSQPNELLRRPPPPAHRAA